MKKLYSLLTLLVMMVSQLNAANISAGDITIEAGQATQLTIGLSNTETNLSGFQFKLYLPEGVTLSKNAKGKFIYTLGERIADHTLSITALSDGGYQFIAYSMDGDVITGTSGALLRVPVVAAENFVPGNGTISDIRLTDLDANKTTCSNVSFAVAAQAIPATGITLSQSALSFTAVNQSATLTATVTPANATNKNVTWTSSNTNVATVSNTGVVTAIADGTATITATTADGTNLSVTCAVTVGISVPATGITLNKTTLSFNAANQTATLTATVTPANATNRNVIWTSSNTNVATVSNTGVVTAIADGTATITATTADGTNLSASCAVTVGTSVPATGITLSQSALSFTAANQTATLTATVTPANATNKSVTWTSSNTNVATVSSTGVVTAIADGTATITATTSDGTNLTAQCAITVNISAITNASLSVENLTIQAGQGGELAVSMTNTETNLSGFQFRLYLPEGLSIATNDKGKFQYTLGDRIANHSLTIRALDDGGYQFIAYSMDGDAITGTSGVLLSVPVVPAENFASGNGTISDIRLTDLDANKTTCSNVSFTITKQAIPATGITLSQSALSFHAVNQMATLTATVTPANATNKSVTWTSSNTNVATVSSTGVVTAVANGTATITATTSDGTNLSATCEVAVNISPTIAFADAAVKALCIANWDTSGDGELDEDEAAAVTSLGEVFKNNTTITSFNELQYFVGLTEISDRAFNGCLYLQSIIFPDGLTRIGNRAFLDCFHLSSVTIPEGVTTIGEQAFYDCNSFSTIHIPASVTVIGDQAFRVTASFDCWSGDTPLPSIRESITVAEGNTVYDSRDNCNAIIEKATNTLLYGSSNTIIPSGVTRIGTGAFAQSIITSIVIPKHINSIDELAFIFCKNLTSVTCLAENVPTTGNSVFSGVPQNTATLYVPAASVNAYKAAAQWKSFGTITAYSSIPATSVALNKTETTLEVAAQEQLTATVLPEDATDKTVTWASSNPEVATVDENGLVTAVAAGTATITATTTDGTELEATCAVTVTPQRIYIETDLTNQFPIDWEGWDGATGYVGWAAPQVTTNDGRQTPACERFDGSQATTGIVFNRTLTGLTNGTYRIELYGASASTKSRDTGMDTDMTADDEGDETAVYLYATTASGTVKQYIPVHWALDFNTSGIATAVLNEVVVTDGTVEIGMYSEKKFTNWEVVQIKGVTALVDAEELHANTLTRAQSALDDAAYVNVTGEERTALSQAIADNTTVTEQTAAAYQTAITALDGATKTFTEAKAAYDGFAAAKTLVEGRSYLYATEAKKSAAEGAAAAVATNAADAVSKKDALMTAYRQYAESSALMESIEGAVDVTATFIRNPRAEEAIDANVWQTVRGEDSGGSIIIRSNEPWNDGNGDTNHRYFDGGNWDASAWDVTFRQKITLPAGRYQLSAMGRSSQDVTLTLFAGEATAEMAHIGAAGGLFDRGWEQTSVVFELTEQTTLSIGVRGVTNVLHNWMSFSGFRLVQSEGYAAYIALNKTGTAIAAGEQEQLTATVLPAEAGQNVVWQSSNPEVATVDETGLVTAMGNGIATITATATYGSTEQSASCSVGVAPVVIFGMCGENVYYILDEDYNLTIFGTGNMYGYGNYSQPWKDYKNQINNVVIEDGVTGIGFNAFYGCSALTSVTIGNSVTSIGIDAFWNCSGLTSVTIGNSVTSIGSFAFENCSGLTSVTIPESVTSIDDCAFNHCSGLTSIFVEAGNTKYDSRNNCNAIIETSTNTLQSGCKNTIIPNSVTSIGASAFTLRIGLTSITIPESVTSIGGFAFYGCSGLASITIPNNVTSIGEGAFSGCSGLTSVTCLAEEVPGTGGSAFYGVPQSTATLYVPSAFIDAYKAANQWNAFGTIAAYAIPATSVALNKTETTIAVSAQEQLTATVLPEDATDKTVTWTSSDPTVATVDKNGLVTAVAAGTATITATTADGTNLTAQCAVTVNTPEPDPGALKMLYAEDISASRDAQLILPVQLDNGEEGITSFQFDVELPEGVTLLGCALSDRKANQGDPSPSQQGDGSYRLVTFSGDNSLFSGTEGTLLYLTLAISADVTPGDYDITLKNIELATPMKVIEQSNTISQLTVLDAIAGDANGDGKVSIFDAVQIVNYILGNTPSPFIFSAADLDGNGKITIFDAVSTVNIILNQGASNQVTSTVQNAIEPQ